MSTPTALESPAWKQRLQTLEARSERLRRDAENASPVLAASYRRRAAELELEGFALALRFAPPGEEPRPLAA